MKQIIYTTILLLTLSICQPIFSQIGIKTDYPQSLFHIDAKGDNSSSIPNDLQIANDVCLSSEGKLGIGILAPQTRLDIVNDREVTGFGYGLKLTPGYGSLAILALQPDGVTTKWEANPALGKVGYLTATVGQSFTYGIPTRLKLTPVSGDIILTNETQLRVPTEGRYLFTVTITGLNTAQFTASSTQSLLSVYVYLSKNDTFGDDLPNIDYYDAIGNNLTDVIEFYQAVNPPAHRVNPLYASSTTSLFAGYCKPSEILTIRLSPTIGFKGQNVIDVFKINPECKVLITVYNI